MSWMDGADLLYLIDDWNTGANGITWMPGSYGLVRPLTIMSYTFIHEVGDNNGPLITVIGMLRICLTIAFNPLS